MAECIFCGIVEGSIPSKKVYEDEHVVAFHDISPAAPVHLLVIPKKHIASIQEVGEEDAVTMGRIFSAINHLAQEFGLSEKGFRIVNNCGQEGGQTVFHLHFHLLGGRQLTWPPG
ncbi:histidine triad nucleotide-binding protein [Marinithermofilum abyssi]|uniref:Histidine triad nucleotide-binding protein n=1 Tax=Marinithermofilum abyssi TaxID=1571185 RepID=A0A8J2VG76_9BACL|nr:histidine triad nucleotide-binding protein [Marinithermofilum abyssi]GGE14616.1 histidine triad nucleotide-binding protein [Marinithermofilum abyssi]